MFYLHPFKSIRTHLYSPNLVSTGTLTPMSIFTRTWGSNANSVDRNLNVKAIPGITARGVRNTIKGGEMLDLKFCKVFWCFGEYHHSPAPSPSSVYNELYKHST